MLTIETKKQIANDICDLMSEHVPMTTVDAINIISSVLIAIAIQQRVSLEQLLSMITLKALSHPDIKTEPFSTIFG